MVSQRSFVVGFVALAFIGLSNPVWSEDAVPSGYRLVASEKKIPDTIFYAVALTESGRSCKHRWCAPALAVDPECRG